MTIKNTFFNKSWAHKTALFLISQTITLFGSSLVQFAISWYIVWTYGSGKMVTLATICGFLPQVLISLFSGVWADRFNRKLLIILADGIIAVFTGLLAVFWILGIHSVVLLMGISIIRSIGAGIQSPAINSLLPDIVPKEHLIRVNGIFMGINSIMTLLSPVAAGWLLSEISIDYIFLVDVATAVTGISLFLFLAVHKNSEPEKVNPVMQDLSAGLYYIKRTVWLRQYLLFYLVYAFMCGPIIFLTPLMVNRSFSVNQSLLDIFGNKENLLVAHEIVFSLGCILGGILIAIFGKKVRNKSHMLILSCFGLGITTLVMGFSPNFFFYLGVMFSMGMTMPFINTSSVTVLQSKVEPEYMGRVFSFISVIGTGVMPLSMTLFGPVSDIFKIEHILIVTGILMMILASAVFRFKEMVKIGKID